MLQIVSETNDAFYTPEKEATEIESLIPEIREKIADTRDMQAIKKFKQLSSYIRNSFGKSFAEGDPEEAWGPLAAGGVPRGRDGLVVRRRIAGGRPGGEGGRGIFPQDEREGQGNYHQG